ncbi:MAG: histidinol phosphate phosphatase domain-containing protein [Endomicrobium sp.]|jgi:histidinol phosphatase-like PHP family hydrolase|nr:histidinol phosphate phosphatase domain-containing protein [Endomicrobium sp.]
MSEGLYMIDLHTHTFFSDGVLSPFELVYRAKIAGYSAIALTDHVDYSNMGFVVSNIVKATKILTESYGVLVLPGAELTYIPPNLIKCVAEECRGLGAKVIVVHGETVSEVVPPGTNMCAVEAHVDILAHPGHLSEKEAEAAAKNNVKVEITTRKGHGVTNKEVAEVALKKKAKLVLDTDTHNPGDLLTKKLIARVLSESGLPIYYYDVMQNNALEIVNGGCC